MSSTCGNMFLQIYYMPFGYINSPKLFMKWFSDIQEKTLWVLHWSVCIDSVLYFAILGRNVPHCVFIKANMDTTCYPAHLKDAVVSHFLQVILEAVRNIWTSLLYETTKTARPSASWSHSDSCAGVLGAALRQIVWWHCLMEPCKNMNLADVLAYAQAHTANEHKARSGILMWQ